jgi:hypothetical protein
VLNMAVRKLTHNINTVSLSQNCRTEWRKCIEHKMCVRFEVFTAVTMKSAVFWDVAPCRSCVNRRF